MSTDDFSPQAKGTVIVTGSAGNLGQAVVKKFIAQGYYVIGTVTSIENMPAEFAADKFEKIEVDLTNEESSQKFIDSVILSHGSIDAAIFTVGGFAMGKIHETTTADILKQYKLNFETTYNVARPVFLHMLQQNSGRIFIVGSKPGLNSLDGKGMVAYGLAKSLIFRLAELMNDESQSKNVVTSVVVPSTIDTPQNRKAMPDANFENWVKPETIADIVYWHCTNEASTIREPIIKIYNNG